MHARGRILCVTCGQDGVPNAGGQRCAACHMYRGRHGVERPPAVYDARPRPCRQCGTRRGSNHARRTLALCRACYERHWRGRQPVPRHRALVCVA